MTLEIVRRIRGNVHGTIDVTALEDAVISHDYVQRLRRIKQLAFLHYVFPGATHTRFEHSLGVMQLAGVAWEKLKVNQRRLADSSRGIPEFAAAEKNVKGLCHGLLSPTFTLMNQVFESDYNLQVLRLAALLHDIGHPPFSHSGERFLPSWTEVLAANKNSPAYMKQWFEEKIASIRAKGGDPTKAKVRHEVFSLLLIEQIMRDIYREYPHLSIEIDPRDIIAVIAPEIKPSPNSPLLANGLYGMLHELISGELDIDRMDYLLRDSRECGVVYGIFDAGRILDGLCIYQDNIDKSLHVAISSSGLAAFEDYLRARQSMYLQVYFHKTAASAEAMMSSLSKRLDNWTLPAGAEEYAAYDEYNIGAALVAAAKKFYKDDMYQLADFERMIKNLLYSRRLWKRIYEVTGKHDDPVMPERIKMVQDIAKEHVVECEHVSSLTSLTRFRPRDQKERSTNYLRLIVRDDLEIPRVVPIEDHASVISNNLKVMVHRLYAEDKVNDHGQRVLDLVKDRVNTSLRKPI